MRTTIRTDVVTIGAALALALALIGFAFADWARDPGRRQSAPERIAARDLQAWGGDRWVALHDVVWRCDESVPRRDRWGTERPERLFRLEHESSIAIWALATREQCRASGGPLEGYLSLERMQAELRSLESARGSNAALVAVLMVGREPVDALRDAIFRGLLGAGILVAAMVLTAIRRTRAEPDRSHAERPTRKPTVLALGGSLLFLSVAAFSWQLASAGRVFTAGIVAVATTWFVGWLVDVCIVQGTARFDETGVSWRRGLERRRAFWSEVMSWHRELEAVQLETPHGALEIVASFRETAPVVVWLRRFVPDRENATRAPSTPLRPRRVALIAAAGFLLVAWLLVAALARVVAAVLAVVCVVLLARIGSQSVIRIHERGIERWLGLRVELLRWSEVQRWREDFRGFHVESVRGEILIEARYWASRAEIRYMLVSHARGRESSSDSPSS